MSFKEDLAQLATLMDETNIPKTIIRCHHCWRDVNECEWSQWYFKAIETPTSNREPEPQKCVTLRM